MLMFHEHEWRFELVPELYRTQNKLSAIVIRRHAKVEDIEFFSPADFSQQIGLMARPSGYRVAPHVHNLIPREITQTQEVLIVRKGVCTVRLYGDSKIVEHEITLNEGDVILLAHGGHEVEMLTDCELLEIKQGPYAGSSDKSPLF